MLTACYNENKSPSEKKTFVRIATVQAWLIRMIFPCFFFMSDLEEGMAGKKDKDDKKDKKDKKKKDKKDKK